MVKTSHTLLVEEAINKVFSDTTVSKAQTKDSLLDLLAECDSLISTIQEDDEDV